MKKSPLIAIAVLAVASSAIAKLPPLSDEAKAKAAEAAAKTAHAGKVDAYQLCKAQDKVVARTNKVASKPGGRMPRLLPLRHRRASILVHLWLLLPLAHRQPRQPQRCR